MLRAAKRNFFLQDFSDCGFPRSRSTIRSMFCPCGTSKRYEECCKPFHEGKSPEHAVLLMRSRFAAYALHLPEYIIETTHPKNPHYQSDPVKWAQEISEFCQNTQFKGLKILESSETGSVATVTFRATLFQDGKDASFTEKSAFEKVRGRWLYRRGEMYPSIPK